jgi:hypothetical protein
VNDATHTKAGLLALAGAARPCVELGASLSTATLAAHPAAHAVATQGGYGTHQASSWTMGALAKPDTFMVIDRKNRPSRPLSELSP